MFNYTTDSNIDQLHFASLELDTKLDFAIRTRDLEKEIEYVSIPLKVFQDKNKKYKSSF